MCASYEARFTVRQLVDLFERAGAPLDVSAGLPNLAAVDEVRPTDTASAVRAEADGRVRLVPMRFGFPPPRPKAGPVVNFRSEGRTIGNGPRQGRCLVPVSGFYEFTGDRYPKTRWIFRDPEAPFLALAAVWRAGEDDGHAFSLLTAAPGPDVEAYHDRGVLPLPAARWADWLLDRAPAEALLIPPPAGTLAVSPAPRSPKAASAG
jgi:putative SOS response-associated peptidase YedK